MNQIIKISKLKLGVIAVTLVAVIGLAIFLVNQNGQVRAFSDANFGMTKEKAKKALGRNLILPPDTNLAPNDQIVWLPLYCLTSLNVSKEELEYYVAEGAPYMLFSRIVDVGFCFHKDKLYNVSTLFSHLESEEVVKNTLNSIQENTDKNFIFEKQEVSNKGNMTMYYYNFKNYKLLIKVEKPESVDSKSYILVMKWDNSVDDYYKNIQMKLDKTAF